MWPFLMVPWAGPQCMKVTSPDHTGLLFKCTVRNFAYVFAWPEDVHVFCVNSSLFF